MLHNLDWLNLNSNRNYPIAEDCSRMDSTSSIQLPNELIVDAIFVSNIYNAFYIKQAFFYEDNIIISVYDIDNIYVGQITINKETHTSYDSYIMDCKNKYKNSSCKLVIGNLSNISLIGNYTFLPENTKFEDTCLIPSIRAVDNIIIGDTYISGDVKLLPGNNIRLRYVEETNSIYIDAIEGEGLGPVCECENENGLDPIETINGLNADNIDIKGVGCIEVSNIGGGIQIANTCETPCCDCEDIEDLKLLLDEKQTLLDDLKARVYALEH